MFTLKRLTTLAAMVVALALVAPIAFAQTKILVIDQARIERDSKAGQSIRTALQGINTQMQNELSPIQTTYQSQQTALQGKVQNMTPEAVQADRPSRTSIVRSRPRPPRSAGSNRSAKPRCA